MEPEGISVTEVRLGLPNTHYYLHWRPAVPPLRPAQCRVRLNAVRAACQGLDWKIFAAGTDNGRLRLVFQTSLDNLESGLAVLLRDAQEHHVCMVQPVAALPFIARYVHESRDTERQVRTARGDTDPAELPDIHYGLFMGERPWAEQMLELLTRCALEAASPPRCVQSLAEIAGSHASSRDAISEAFRSGRFSLKDIAEHFDMHFSEVSAIVNAISRQSRGHEATTRHGEQTAKHRLV